MVLEMYWALIGIDFAAVLAISIFLYTFFYYPLSKNDIKKEKVIYALKKSFAKDVKKDIKILTITAWVILSLLILIRITAYYDSVWTRIFSLIGWTLFILQVFMIFFFWRWSFKKASLTKNMIETPWTLEKILREFKVKNSAELCKIVQGKKLQKIELEKFVLSYIYDYNDF